MVLVRSLIDSFVVLVMSSRVFSIGSVVEAFDFAEILMFCGIRGRARLDFGVVGRGWPIALLLLFMVCVDNRWGRSPWSNSTILASIVKRDGCGGGIHFDCRSVIWIRFDLLERR